MIQGKWFPPGSDAPEALAIRQAVFGRGGDPLDAAAWQTVVYQGGTPCGTGRIWWQDGAFHLGDIGVLPDFRQTGMGDLVLRLLLYKAQTHYACLVQVQCPADVAGYFTRLGFVQQEEHQGMITLVIRGEDIQLDSCQGCKENCPNAR